MALRFNVKKKQDNSKRWIAIFIGLIMLASTIGTVFVFYAPSSTDFRYGGLSFKQVQQGGYVAKIGGNQAYFAYRPEELSDINVTENIVSLLANSRSAWVTYDPNSTLTQEMALLQFDLALLLDARKGTFVQPAFTEENQLNIPVKTCRDATPFVPVLLLQKANDTTIGTDLVNQDCIVLSAAESEFQRAADRLKYAVLGEGK